MGACTIYRHFIVHCNINWCNAISRLRELNVRHREQCLLGGREPSDELAARSSSPKLANPGRADAGLEADFPAASAAAHSRSRCRCSS
jgi:hypothetical protein